jgi:hypothetical protein
MNCLYNFDEQCVIFEAAAGDLRRLSDAELVPNLYGHLNRVG